MFRVTTLDPNAPPRDARPGASTTRTTSSAARPSSPSPASSRRRSRALALTRVYTFGPTFRAENSNTSRHLAEFWMVEPEMAFCDLDGDMQLAEDFLKSVIRGVLDACPDDMAVLRPAHRHDGCSRRCDT